MDDGGLLLVIAQVALGLIGFGALLIALQPKPISTWAREDQFRFNAFLHFGLNVIFASLLPRVLNQVILDEALSWRLASAVFFCLVFYRFVIGFTRGRRIVGAGLMSVSTAIFVMSMFILALCVFLLGGLVAGWPIVPQGGQYTLVVFLILFLTALTFVRLLQFVGGQGTS